MPKVIGGSLDAHREHTRGLLFESFGRLLYQRGYDDLTLAEVARDAGLARTAIYNYFPDKESSGGLRHRRDRRVRGPPR